MSTGIERIAAERQRQIDKQAWQPIETAPKDGTKILLWRSAEGKRRPAHAGFDCWQNNCWWGTRPGQQPTHWQPLPAPPEAAP